MSVPEHITKELERLREENARLAENNARLTAENELLRQKVDLLIRKIFGARSEKLVSGVSPRMVTSSLGSVLAW